MQRQAEKPCGAAIMYQMQIENFTGFPDHYLFFQKEGMKSPGTVF